MVAFERIRIGQEGKGRFLCVRAFCETSIKVASSNLLANLIVILPPSPLSQIDLPSLPHVKKTNPTPQYIKNPFSKPKVSIFCRCKAVKVLRLVRHGPPPCFIRPGFPRDQEILHVRGRRNSGD